MYSNPLVFEYIYFSFMCSWRNKLAYGLKFLLSASANSFIRWIISVSSVILTLSFNGFGLELFIFSSSFFNNILKYDFALKSRTKWDITRLV